MNLLFVPTARGFMRAEFTDRYEQTCSLQESSLATEACVWLGVDVPLGDGEICLQCNTPQPKRSQRMHLTQEMVRALLPALRRFANTGALDASTSAPNTDAWQQARAVIQAAIKLADRPAPQIVALLCWADDAVDRRDRDCALRHIQTAKDASHRAGLSFSITAGVATPLAGALLRAEEAARDLPSAEFCDDASLAEVQRLRECLQLYRAKRAVGETIQAPWLRARVAIQRAIQSAPAATGVLPCLADAIGTFDAGAYETTLRHIRLAQEAARKADCWHPCMDDKRAALARALLAAEQAVRAIIESGSAGVGGNHG